LSLSAIEERDSCSLYSRERLSFLYRGERLVLYIYRKGSVSLLYTKEALSLCKGGLSLFSVKERESLLLSAEKRVSFSCIERRQTPPLYKGESLSLPSLQRGDSFSLLIPEKRERLPSLYTEEGSFSLQGRASVSSRERTGGRQGRKSRKR